MDTEKLATSCWKQPPDDMSITFELVKWWLREHFEPAADKREQTFASELWASYLEAAIEAYPKLPILTAAAFGNMAAEMMVRSPPRTVWIRDPDGRRTVKSGVQYPIKPKKGVTLFRLEDGRAQELARLHLNAMIRTGAGQHAEDLSEKKRSREGIMESLRDLGFEPTLGRENESFARRWVPLTEMHTAVVERGIDVQYRRFATIVQAHYRFEKRPALAAEVEDKEPPKTVTATMALK